MPAIDFPNTPTAGQTFSVGYQTWSYDGAVWRLVPTSLVSSFSRVACNSNTSTVTVNVDVQATGCSTALNLTAGDKALCIGTFDVGPSTTLAGSSFVGSLYAGPTGSTVVQPGFALWVIAGTPVAGDRQTVTQSWIFTVPSTGSYTFALYGKHTTTTGTFTMFTPSTTLSVLATR